MTDREAMQQALDALKQAKDSVADWGAYASEYFQHKHNLQKSIDDIQAQITVLSERLAQPEQALEPVAEVKLMMTGGNAGIATRIVEIDDPMRERLHPGQMLYTAPPQRKPLTDDEIEACRQQGYDHSGLSASFDFVKAARAVEAKLKEKTHEL